MQVYGRSDKGRVRQNNQDAFMCGTLAENVLFSVVCDGMGGANGGNIASALAVKVIAARIVERYRENMSPESIQFMLESAIAAANIEVFDTATADPALQGMGTTVVATVVTGQQAVVAHIGDSRAYLVSEGDITQITRDHSVVQQMIERGELTKEEARTHPNKHFITRALGVEENVESEVDILELPEGSKLLICTDGLSNMVEEAEMTNVLHSMTPGDAVEKLIVAANMAGGSDNITVSVFA